MLLLAFYAIVKVLLLVVGAFLGAGIFVAIFEQLAEEE